jgi:GNAT superfamily N-acetyltransferase
MVDIAAAREQALSVRKGDEAEAMAGVLARAFFDDPVFTWVLRGDVRRMRNLRRGFEMFLRRVWLAEQQTYTTAGTAGVAVWEPPGAWKLGPGEQLRVLAKLEAGHPSEPASPPHYYLAFLGVDPPWQGRGLGSALLMPVLERCDRERVPAYLEASTARNRALYERLGFDVTEEFKLARAAPAQWRMWREPR